MPVISSNTLFHFTPKIERLKKILLNGFRPNYCMENLDAIQKKGEAVLNPLAIPMVCFCDLPLSQISKHCVHYGNYGLGMKKDWAKDYGISPVIYVYQDAQILDEIKRIDFRTL